MLHHWIIARDLAQERSRDLDREAARRRLVALSRAGAAPARPGRIRTLVAMPLRTFSNATQFLADAPCTAATRLEGRSA
jgi:16S rRNA C967 or C1407 C5-methylase (RsmB/RsmF family)